MLENINKYLTKNKLSIIFILIFAALLTGTCIWINSHNPILGHSYRDVYLYLIEALRFSGVEIGGYQYINYLSPFIPFLTSIFFNMGFVDISTIIIISGIFYFFAIAGMYCILKLKFSNKMAIFGTILYSCLIINLRWVANGTLDIPSITLVIWALYFFIRGMETNQKYFYLAFPLAVLGFFAKYTGALVIATMCLYFLSKQSIIYNLKKYIKNIIGGALLGIITSIPFFMYFFTNDIPLGFINQASEISSRTSTTATSGGELIGNDLFFYIKGLIYYIGSDNYIIGIIILAVIICGIISLIYLFISVLKQLYKENKDETSQISKLKVDNKIIYCLLTVSIILIAFSFLTAGLFSFIYSEAIFFFAAALFIYTMNKIDIKSKKFPYLRLNITMFALFFGFLLFFSAHLTKADRYFTAMAPGFVFISTLAINCLLENKKINLNIKVIIPVILSAILIISSISFLTTDRSDSLVTEEQEVVKWFDNNTNIDNINISADRGPIYTWYFQKEVNYIQGSFTPEELNENLLNNGSSYYIRLGDGLNLENYTEIKSFDETIIYQRN